MVAYLCPQYDSDLDGLGCGSIGGRVPVVDGIPRFVSSEHYWGSFGFPWRKHQRTRPDSAHGPTISRDHLFGQSRWRVDQFRGKTVLECGSGAGRFTEILAAAGAEVYSCDISRTVIARGRR